MFSKTIQLKLGIFSLQGDALLKNNKRERLFDSKELKHNLYTLITIINQIHTLKVVFHI